MAHTRPLSERTGWRAPAPAARVVSAGLVLLVGLAAACQSRSPLGIRPGPVVQQQKFALSAEYLKKIAVIPFYPDERLGSPAPRNAPRPADPPVIPRTAEARSTERIRMAAPDQLPREAPAERWEIAALVGNFIAEAIASQGIAAIAPNDVEMAFTGEGHPVPRLDARTAAQLASRTFGATAIVLGKVSRYRERVGSGAGATRPASVAFEISLHQVPTGRRLWTGRFDETQHSLSENIFRARNYPGGGTRWLSAAEFARWGADEVIKTMSGSP